MIRAVPQCFLYTQNNFPNQALRVEVQRVSSFMRIGIDAVYNVPGRGDWWQFLEETYDVLPVRNLASRKVQII